MVGSRFIRKPRSDGLPLPLRFIERGARCRLINHGVVSSLRHGPEGRLPILPRKMRRTDHDLIRLGFDLYFLSEMSLFQECLGKANALRVTDLYDVCLHKHIVITGSGACQEALSAAYVLCRAGAAPL